MTWELLIDTLRRISLVWTFRETFYLDLSMIMLAFLSLNSLKSLTKKIQLNTSAKYKNNRGLSAEANKVGDKLIAIADEKVITREAIIIKLVFDLPYNRIIIKQSKGLESQNESRFQKRPNYLLIKFFPWNSFTITLSRSEISWWEALVSIMTAPDRIIDSLCLLWIALINNNITKTSRRLWLTIKFEAILLNCMSILSKNDKWLKVGNHLAISNIPRFWFQGKARRLKSLIEKCQDKSFYMY